jgi:hypothetical protein
VSYSQAEQRQAFADVLTGVSADVDGVTVTVTGYPVQPVTVAPYSAWPIWSATRPVGGLGCIVVETDWIVALALPGADAQTWSANGDALTDAVLEALSRYPVERVEPGQVLVADGGAMPCLRFAVNGL